MEPTMKRRNNLINNVCAAITILTAPVALLLSYCSPLTNLLVFAVLVVAGWIFYRKVVNKHIRSMDMNDDDEHDFPSDGH